MILSTKKLPEILLSPLQVCNIFDYGFLEKVYQKAMQVKLVLRGHTAETEYRMKVEFKGVIVGDYASDLFVDSEVLVELKVAASYNSKDEAQLLNQLKATEKEIGMFINFGREKVEY